MVIKINYTKPLNDLHALMLDDDINQLFIDPENKDVGEFNLAIENGHETTIITTI